QRRSRSFLYLCLTHPQTYSRHSVEVDRVPPEWHPGSAPSSQAFRFPGILHLIHLSRVLIPSPHPAPTLASLNFSPRTPALLGLSLLGHGLLLVCRIVNAVIIVSDIYNL
ncbi:unnamed protein product, partial [Gulo gulo]